MKRLVRLALSLVGVSLLSCAAFAQSAAPNADSYTYSNTPTTNYGTATALFVQKGQVTSASYLRFDLSPLPSGVSVSKATLRLFVDQVVGPGNFDVYPINGGWIESGLTYTNAPALGASATGGHPVAFTASSLNQFVVVDITPLVTGWANGSIANHGLALALTTATGAVAFDSKEAIATSHQPELEIALTGPTGPQGPQGAQGPTGMTGAQGAQGPTGVTGPQGPIGMTGAQGPAGTNGANGQSFNFTGVWLPTTFYNAYDVVDYNGSTYDASVAIPPSVVPPGSNPNWVLMANVGQTGPAGPAGAIGPAGPMGPQGNGGPVGPQGSQGIPGFPGPKGPTGSQGSPGPIGPTGSQGLPGVTQGYAAPGVNNTDCSIACTTATTAVLNNIGNYLVTASVVLKNQSITSYSETCSLYFGNGVNAVAFGTTPTIVVAGSTSANPTGTATLISTFDSVQPGYYVWAQCSGGNLGTVFMTYATVSAISLVALN